MRYGGNTAGQYQYHRFCRHWTPVATSQSHSKTLNGGGEAKRRITNKNRQKQQKKNKTKQ